MTNEQAIIELRDLISDENTDRENEALVLAIEKLRDKRPQGEWMKKVDDVGFISYICSSCGFELELEDCSDSYYCTNCGAKMKERKNE